MSQNNGTPLHIAMYPWLAMGHITSFLRIGNKLAERGHRISFFLPPKTQLRFTSQNHYPELITFISITLPPVDGFPAEAETTNDIPAQARPLLMTAMDLTKDTIEAHLVDLRPNFVFFDFTCWMPELAHKHGIKSIYYISALLVRAAYILHLSVITPMDQPIKEAHLISPLPSFPSPHVTHRAHEARSLIEAFHLDFGGGLTLLDRVGKSLRECDAIGIKTFREMEGVYYEFLEKKYGKPVLTAGPVLPDPTSTKLDERFEKWLAGFGYDQVIYCAFGSECTIDLVSFQELVLGLELTGINMSQNNGTPLHIAMYPWLAMGHITSFLRIGNKLAEQGHRISFFLPPKTQLRFMSQNHYPELITFITISLPQVDGFPAEAETTNDIPAHARSLLMTAMDLTKDTIEAHLVDLRPNFVFFDFTCWMPELTQKHGIKSIYYSTTLLVRAAYMLHLLLITPMGQPIMLAHLVNPLPSFPSPLMKHQAHEARSMIKVFQIDSGGGLTLFERVGKSFRECDAIGIKACSEMEGVYYEFVNKKYGKHVLTAGPVLPDPSSTQLDDQFDRWLAGFGSEQVIYCAFGSECTLDLVMFQELVLGLEHSGRPFLAALKAPTRHDTIESALPEGFLERTKDRGIVYGGWVQQQLILRHPSVGCFVTHCGAGSLSEAMVNKCQLVMIPHAVDQFINARMMSLELRVGVEVERRDEDGFFSREDVRKAVESVMDENSIVGKEVRANHAKWREFILKDGVEESYINGFIDKLYDLLG